MHAHVCKPTRLWRVVKHRHLATSPLPQGKAWYSLFTHTQNIIFTIKVLCACQIILTTNTELSLKVTPELAELLED